MSFFKKFSDVLVGFCALMGITQLLRIYMNYTFSEEELSLGLIGKIKVFLSPEAKDEPRHFTIFVCLMILYFVVSTAFRKLPVIPLIFSPLPLLSSFILFFDNILDKNDFFYILCLSVGLAGALYDSLAADRDKEKLFTHWTSGLVGALFAFISLRLSSLAELTALYADDPLTRSEDVLENAQKLELLGIDLFEAISPEQKELMTLLGILVIISVIVSFIFRGAYFIDLGFSLFLLIFTVVKWHAEVLAHSEALILGMAIIYFAFRIAIFFGAPFAKKKKAITDTTEQNT